MIALYACIAAPVGNISSLNTTFSLCIGSPNKGFSFLTEEGPHSLAEELVRRGYGDTNTIVNELKKRDDIGKKLDDVETYEDEYFDPRSLFASGVESDD